MHAIRYSRNCSDKEVKVEHVSGIGNIKAPLKIFDNVARECKTPDGISDNRTYANAAYGKQRSPESAEGGSGIKSAKRQRQAYCAPNRHYGKKRKRIIVGFGKALHIRNKFRPAVKDGKDGNALQSLPEGIREGMTLPVQKAEVKEGKTTPPKRFTEDTMLSLMESAGAKEIPAEAERKGLGTPATRAATIEKLVQKGFLTRRGDKKTKYLVPTDRGISLITVMPELIQSPTLTADWEQKLVLIERGEYDPSAFMQEIEDMISTLVKTYEVVKGADVLMNGKKVMGACPHCGAEVMERQKGWFCSNRECRFVLWKDNRYFTKIGKHLTGQMVEKLLRDGRIRLKDCKSQKTGKTYNADLLLSTEDDGRAVFSMEFEKGGGRNERKKRT